MNILVTGASSGIGLAVVRKFLDEGHCVTGFDIKGPAVTHPDYRHFVVDICKEEQYPEDIEPEILINVAGVQDSPDDIEVNLKGTIRITERYACSNKKIKSVVMIGSASGHTGSEFPEYAASKGGIISYVKNVANRLAPDAICNSIDPGGVLTELNRPVMDDKKLWDQIMELTPLKRWATPEEIAEWVYFTAAVNRFMTGQNLLIDGGEAGSTHFVWPEDLK